MIRIEGNKSALYQWDLNQRVVLTDIASISAGIEVHYSITYNLEESCLVAPSYFENGNIYADIPNKLLQQSGVVSVYLYVQDENKAWTEHRVEIIIIPRSKPANYVYTETQTEVFSFKELEKRIEEIHNDNGQLSTLIKEDMLPAVYDENGKIITDENGKILLRY